MPAVDVVACRDGISAEEHCRADRGDGQKEEHGAGEADLRAARNESGARRAEQVDARDRHAQAHDRAADSEQRAFREQVLDQSSARGAERAPHGQLATAAGDSSHQEIRRVRRRDEKDEGDRAEDHREGRSDIAEHEVLEIHRRPCRLGVLIRRLPEREDRPIDGVQLFRRQRHRGARAQPPEGDDEEWSSPRRGVPLRRGEDIGSPLERPERAGQDTDNGVVETVEADGLSNGGDIAAEMALGESLRDHDAMGPSRTPSPWTNVRPRTGEMPRSEKYPDDTMRALIRSATSPWVNAMVAMVYPATRSNRVCWRSRAR